jgi:hypothetical protein
VRVAYIRISKGLPTEAEQRAALTAAGVTAEEMAEAWIDRQRKKGDPPFAQRDYMLGAVRDGDEVHVAQPGVVGSGEPDILDFLRLMTEQGGILCVASTGRRHRFAPELAEALALVRDIRMDERRMVMAKARQGLKNLGRKKFTPQQWKEAKALWTNPDVTAEAAAERSGIGMRTLYRKWGPKGTPSFGRVKGRAK